MDFKKSVKSVFNKFAFSRQEMMDTKKEFNDVITRQKNEIELLEKQTSDLTHTMDALGREKDQLRHMQDEANILIQDQVKMIDELKNKHSAALQSLQVMEDEFKIMKSDNFRMLQRISEASTLASQLMGALHAK